MNSLSCECKVSFETGVYDERKSFEGELIFEKWEEILQPSTAIVIAFEFAGKVAVIPAYVHRSEVIPRITSNEDERYANRVEFRSSGVPFVNLPQDEEWTVSTKNARCFVL